MAAHWAAYNTKETSLISQQLNYLKNKQQFMKSTHVEKKDFTCAREILTKHLTAQ